MPALSSMTLADGATTPVNHTFAANGVSSDNTVTWMDKDHGTPVSYTKVTSRLRDPVQPAGNVASASRVYRHVMKITMPVVATVDGVETKVGELSREIITLLPETSTLQQRKDLNALANSAMVHAHLKAQVESLEYFW